MKVVIPMAGRGSRFAEKGWVGPKPLIEVAGRPMILWALESISNLAISEVIFIVLTEHETTFQISELLHGNINSPCRIISIPEVTEGQLCTVLAAKSFIDTPEGVLIMACDSLIIHQDLAGEIATIQRKKGQGMISVASLPGDRWSFAKINDNEEVIEVAEKKRISDYASTGMYYFSEGKQLVEIGEEMINRKEKTRGEYYVIPVYQKMIDNNAKIGISRATTMWDMGTPTAKAHFEQNLDRIKQALAQRL